MLKQGRVYGYTLADQTYDDPIFVSDTVGALADALAAHVADCSGSPEAHVSSSDCVDLTIDSEGDILDPLEPAFEAVPASGRRFDLWK